MAATGFRKELSAELKASLPAQLPAYLKNQRWFGAKAREISSVEVLDLITLQRDQFEAVIVLARADYKGGGSDLYSIPILHSRAELDADTNESNSALRIAEKNSTSEIVFTDALKNREFLLLLLDAFHRDLVFRGESGELHASRTNAFALQETGAAGSLHPRAVKAEQSNTSIAYGDRMMLKFFRRLEEGVNPDLEVGGFLTNTANFAHTPQLLGALEYRSDDGKRMTQGILQAFVPNHGDAWRYTMEAISHFYNQIAAIEDERPAPWQNVPEIVQQDLAKFLDSIALLGKRTAEMHIALASDSADAEFSPVPFDSGFQKNFADSLLQLTNRVFSQLRGVNGSLPASIAAQAQEILSRESEIKTRFTSALDRPVHAMRTRIHGDYHLGQVLYTGSDFVIIDFEGEPARPLAERRVKRSPLQDVAGMLRSFHYAAHAPLLTSEENLNIEPDKKVRLNKWAEAWASRVTDRFLREYLTVTAEASFLPATPEETHGLLQLHILEKAVYELGYELNNRPAWVAIPLEGISKALDS